MKYYSTNKKAPLASLKRAVIKGLAGDKGLYMPENIDLMKDFVIGEMKNMTFQEISCVIARALFGDDVDGDTLDRIVKDTISFDAPIVHLHDNIYCLELFHGPTMAFKDVGARFMARLLAYFIDKEGVKDVNVLVATSGDTGSAVANGFLGMEGINVYVLYPKGKVSAIQECQFATLGRNITTLEIDGTFDDCQAIVKAAFMDEEMNEHSKLTSANSINVARFLPQSFYYFYAYAQLDKIGKADNLVISVPSGNFGNLAAGLFAHWMGLPVKRFIAANNRNDVFLDYLRTGRYKSRPSVSTLANAMDVGDPSNFARITDLFSIYPNPYAAILKRISGYSYTDEVIAATMRQVYRRYGYVLDPHGACGYEALSEERQAYELAKIETGLFLETAHPAKFKASVDTILGVNLDVPDKLRSFMEGEKQSISLSRDFEGFKRYFLSR
ncbi:MAG: threonine synthase [Tannerellaceae bacterium]|jgi:threonine synthase|nr:threonine synthase [Tannerellaceae bacterium]